MVKVYDLFQKFYQTKHSGRKLNWLFQLSKAELKTNYLKASKTGYTLQVNEKKTKEKMIKGNLLNNYLFIYLFSYEKGIYISNGYSLTI